MSLSEFVSMHKPFHFTSLFPLIVVVALSACSIPRQDRQDSYHEEDFSSSNVYARSFPGSAQATCEAGRRALLSQGYVIHEASPSLVRGRKNFQPESGIHMQTEFHVVCAPNSKGSNSTTVFANAVNDRYSLRKSSNSASLGVGALGSVSLPFGSSDDSLVKVASETVSNKKFYGSFFELLESYLDAAGDSPAQVDRQSSKDDKNTLSVKPVDE
ncbi:DUF2242 domain-containing protein [Noviherbaspirillum cavernae]|uniref:DUF2242 domain-containing protein n=1 Tax=Noviherbaspirillum cavernae TaxID=2320862 RepID=A0A418WWJ5_9BURK|nr:DUF2242 domain-containing protein [Noviherbaspirillum cavernae]RJF97028.1 DUF2242 domain-containing protein [Noviherbaspirillum cavernae]